MSTRTRTVDGYRIVTTTSPITKQTRHAVWSPNGVNMKSFATEDAAERWIKDRTA